MTDKVIINVSDRTKRVVPLTPEEANQRAVDSQEAAANQSAAEAKQTAWENAVNGAASLSQLKTVILNNLRPNK